MYVSTWPALSPLLPFRRESTCRKPFPFIATHKHYGYLARGLIYHLFRALELGEDDVVLVPDYHHGNEVRAIRAAGAKVRFYRVKLDLEPDLEDLRRKLTPDVRVLFVIHYLGWPQPIHELVDLARSHGAMVIEDCALSMFTELEGRPIGTFGDHAIFCLYKMLPVPNGGLIVTNKTFPPALEKMSLQACDVASVAGRTLELAFETVQTHAEWTGRQLLAMKRAAGSAMSAARLHRVPVGDVGFDRAAADLAVSELTLHLLERIDFEEIPETRRLRFEQLGRRLRGRATFLDREARPGTCPLFFPLLVEDKHAAVQALLRRGIGAVEFWNSGDPLLDPRESRAAGFLRKHLIELPIHQDVTPDQVDYIADVVLALRLGLRGGMPSERDLAEPEELRRAG